MNELLGIIILLVSLVAGIGLVFFGLPGTYVLLFGALAYDLATWSLAIGPGPIIMLVILVAFGEIFNAMVGAAKEKRIASSFIGTAGALIGSAGGGALGAMKSFPAILIGIAVGGAFGAFLFELIHYLSVTKASRASIGAFFGRVMATFVKFEVSVVMLVVIAVSVAI